MTTEPIGPPEGDAEGYAIRLPCGHHYEAEDLTTIEVRAVLHNCRVWEKDEERRRNPFGQEDR